MNRLLTHHPNERKKPPGAGGFSRVLLLAVLILLLLLTAGCGGGGASSADAADSGKSASAADSGKNADSGKGGGYSAPDFKDSSFHEDEASESGGMAIDTSATEKGYVAVSGNSSSRLKFQVIKDGETYTYDMASDGTPSVFPLQMGNGTYQFQIMENIVDQKYAQAFTASADVQLKDEFQPFLRPSDYADYSEDSKCVKEAAKIAQNSETAMDVVSGIYDYVCGHITYDKEKAASVTTGYLPEPDETLETGKGICFDYASLTAAMLRSQGIPARVIFGYVAPDDLYHAWNMFYTKETGWVLTEFEVEKNTWNRIDATFAAGGAGADFIGDGSHYSDVYMY